MDKNKLEKLHIHIDELVAQKMLTFDILLFILNTLIKKELLTEKEILEFLDNNTSRYYGNLSEERYKIISVISSLIKEGVTH